MPELKWNLCTSFAAAGTAIAYAFLFLLFGFHWQYVPAAIVGIVAAYGAGTALGELATRVQLGRYRVAGVIAGVGIAWCTLFAGSLAIALTTFSVATIDGLVAAPSGQPFTNVLAEIAPRLAKDLLKTPLVAGVLFGLVPAALLGIVYGFVLTRRFDGSATVVAANRAWVRGAAAVTLLVPLFLLIAVIRGPYELPDPVARLAGIPIAVRGCNSYETAAGAEAVCYGSPCVDGVCDWDKEQDAFELHVRPPAGSAWRWVGGGIGTTQRPDIIRHNIYWAQFEPDGTLNEGSPRRHTSYELHFDGDTVSVGESVFQFEPGMRLNIQFLDNWSVVASEASRASR